MPTEIDPRQSVLTLYTDVPFDSSYNHTILFPDKKSQDAYFESKRLSSGHTFTKVSYLRHTAGRIRIQSNMSLLTNVNYISFYNPYKYQSGIDESTNPPSPIYTDLNYEDINYYAFVDQIEYVNENTVEIAYTIDQMQTWMFYYELNPCYVEREHVRDDSIGANRVKEGLDGGDYVISGFENLDYWGWETIKTSYLDMTNTSYIVIATQPYDQDNSGNTPPKPAIINGVFGTLTVYICHNTNQFKAVLLNYYNGTTKSFEPIIGVYQIPSFYVETSADESNPVTIKDYVQFTLGLDTELGMGGFRNWNPITGEEDLYIPLNNKMYTHPYNFIMLESPDGSSVQLKYENFQHFPDADHHLSFLIYLAVFPEPETMCLPVNYESTQFMANLRSALCSKAYPTVPLASSAFQAWWAQNRYSMPIVDAFIEGNQSYFDDIGKMGYDYTSKLDEILTTTAHAAYNLGTSGLSTQLQTAGYAAKTAGAGATWTRAGAGAIEEAGNLMLEVGKQLATREGHKAIPNTTATKANNGGITHQTHTDCYKVYYTQIRPEYARIIDRYFSTYGYAIHYVKEPDITSRVVWNYIKTVGCTIREHVDEAGSRFVPFEAEKIICSIYDRGITFWHWPELIHQYVHTLGGYSEENMFNPIGEPYNWPGQPGYPGDPIPVDNLGQNVKIYFKPSSGIFNDAPYVMGQYRNDISSITVMQMSEVIIPGEGEDEDVHLDGVYEISGSVFNNIISGNTITKYGANMLLFMDAQTYEESTIVSNIIEKKNTNGITTVYKTGSDGVSQVIGSYYIGVNNPYEIPSPSDVFIYFQTYKNWRNVYCIGQPKKDYDYYKVHMQLVSGATTIFECIKSDLTEISQSSPFTYEQMCFSNSSTFEGAKITNIYNIENSDSPITVYDVTTNEPVGAFYIGTRNPFSDTPVITETNKIYFQYLSNVAQMYIAWYQNGNVGSPIAMTQMTGIETQQRVWYIETSALDSYSQFLFTPQNPIDWQGNPLLSEIVNKVSTDSPKQVYEYQSNVLLGNYYIGKSNPFTT